jgi:formamidopyrimidine-DNA glycosylase
VPELPEVETIRRELAPRVVGRRLGKAWAFPHPKFTPALDVVGATVTYLERRGKYLLFGLDGGIGAAAGDDGVQPGRREEKSAARELVVHLGMTGALLLRACPQPDAAETGGDDPYVRAWWILEAGRDSTPVDPRAELLVYRDVRRFGRLATVEAGRYSGTLAMQGPDALDPVLSAEMLWRSMQRSRRAVKTQLLSQRPLAGIGNIYADEALWLAGVHPRCRRVSRRQATVLLDAIREVLEMSLGNDGTTLRDYRLVTGGSGRNRDRLACYGRAGQPCLRCGVTLRRMVLDGRSTTWCPTCQRR